MLLEFQKANSQNYKIIRYLKDKGKILNPNAKVSFYAKTGRTVVREIN
jgi:hypothetical protein